MTPLKVKPVILDRTKFSGGSIFNFPYKESRWMARDFGLTSAVGFGPTPFKAWVAWFEHKHSNPAGVFRIRRCHDPLMWYSRKIGEPVMIEAYEPKYAWAREPAGYRNIIHYADLEA